MFKKVLLPFMAALLIAASFSGTALAAEEDPPELIKARGDVIEVNTAAEKFRVKRPDGTIMTFFVNEDTHFRGELESLEELLVGWKAGVAARDGEDGKLWAVLVIAGEPVEHIRVRGEIIQVDPGEGSYRLLKPDGTEMSFLVNEKTRYNGQVHSLEDLQVGWKAAVVAREIDRGSLMTTLLVAGDAPEYHKSRGIVTAVDLGAGMFEIKKTDGTVLSYQVDEKTRYRGQLSSLEEMQEGWHAGVAAKTDQDGGLIAVLVIAGTRPDQVRAQGLVIAVDVGAGKFLLEKHDGTVLKLLVDENTNFRGPVSSLSELVEGVKAGVVALKGTDGSLVARLVLAGKPRSEGPPPELEPPLEARPFETL
jgi:hypothetical protein